MPKRNDEVHKVIDKLGRDALMYFVNPNYPNLAKKFRKLLREEYDAGKLYGDDILDWNTPWRKES